MPITAGPSEHRHAAARFGLVAVLTTAAAVGVTGAGGPSTATATADGLRPFDDCAQVHDWYVDALRPLVGPYGIGYGGVVRVQEAVALGTADGSAGPGRAGTVAELDGTGTAVGATGTNVQEVGADEPDVMKVAAGRLYTTSGDRLVVLDLTGGAPREVGSLALPALTGETRDGWSSAVIEPVPTGTTGEGGTELLLDGDRVVLLTPGWHDPDGPRRRDTVSPGAVVGPVGAATTTSTVVDVSDPAAPRVVSQQEVEGSLVGARLSDGLVRVVTTSTPSLPPVTAPPPGYRDGRDPAWEEAATQANLEALERLSGDELLPHLLVRDGDGTVVDRLPAVACEDVERPAEGAGAGTLVIRSIDPRSEPDPVVDATAVAAQGDMVYASADRLYVATTRGGWRAWSGNVRGAVPDATTELHGFATDDAGTTYLASGEVAGLLLGRWAMSARDGRLRVATTTGSLPAGAATEAAQSLVTVLAERGGDLVEEGQVGGLGRGETIRAVRWFDEAAVVVTFRQSDPLYVVDLSDPTAPAVTGELEVPGYSGYLHPVGDGRLLGVGQDATADGQTTGVLVQTVDLSDPTAPAQVGTWTEPDTWTTVEGDSRQFSYLPGRRTALVPIADATGTAGLQAIAVGQDGTLTEAGRFDFTGPAYRVLVRATPAGDAVAVLTATSRGRAVTLLDTSTFVERGTVALD